MIRMLPSFAHSPIAVLEGIYEHGSRLVGAFLAIRPDVALTACGALQGEYALSASKEKVMAAFLELKKAHPYLSVEELTPFWCAKVRSDPELIDAVYEWAFDSGLREKGAREH